MKHKDLESDRSPGLYVLSSCGVCRVHFDIGITAASPEEIRVTGAMPANATSVKLQRLEKPIVKRLVVLLTPIILTGGKIGLLYESSV